MIFPPPPQKVIDAHEAVHLVVDKSVITIVCPGHPTTLDPNVALVVGETVGACRLMCNDLYITIDPNEIYRFFDGKIKMMQEKLPPCKEVDSTIAWLNEVKELVAAYFEVIP